MPQQKIKGRKIKDRSLKEAELIVVDGVDDVPENIAKYPEKLSSGIQWDEKKYYKDEYKDRMLCMKFDRILVENCSIPINVQFFLDDTCNGKYGTGNTRFVDLQPIQGHETGIIHQCMIDVEWYMMGAKDGAVPMPDVGKMVVRGSTSFCFGQNVPPNNLNPLTGKLPDGEKPKYCGILGGCAFPLEEMFQAFVEKGEYKIPIYNSYMRMSDLDPTLPPGQLKVCDVHLDMKKESASLLYKDFIAKKSKLFTASKLPNFLKNQTIASTLNQLPNVIDKLMVSGMRDGRIDVPLNAPSNFLQLSFQQQEAILDKDKTTMLGRGGYTASAELYGVPFLHANAIITAMCNENEQVSCTNNRVLVASFHAAMAIFEVHGFTLDSLEKEVMSGKISEALASFGMAVISAVHTFASTQQYGFDIMIMKMPGKKHLCSISFLVSLFLYHFSPIIFFFAKTYLVFSCKQVRLLQVLEKMDGLPSQARIGSLPMHRHPSLCFGIPIHPLDPHQI